MGMHNHMRRISTYKMSSPYSSLYIYEHRRDANERGQSNLTHAVWYAFSSTTPIAQECNWSRWLSGRESASRSGGRGFESRLRHTKGVKMVPVATLLGVQHYKARNGFSSTNTYHTTNFATLTKLNKSEKSLIIINVCIHRRTVWKTGSYAKYVILLNYRDYHYHYYYYYYYY